MHTKSMLRVLLFTLSASILFSACQSSKIAYGNSYYFKQTPKSTNQVADSERLVLKEVEKISSRGAELYASLDEGIIVQRDAATLVEQAQQHLLAAVEKEGNAELKTKVQRTSLLAKEMGEQELTKREKRAKHQEIRKEVRSLIKKYESMSPNETNELDKNLKIALILAIVGIILLIIPVGILQILGLLSFIGGLIFLIIWLINEA